MPGCFCVPRRVLDKDRDEKNRDQSPWQIGGEDPAPIVRVGDEAAERRSEHGRDDRCDRGDSKRGAAFFRRKRVENDRLLARLQAAAEEALQESKDDQLREAACDTAQERTKSEYG